MGGRPRRDADRSLVILIDTSAWVEFLRDTGSATCKRVDSLLESDIGICDAVRMEMLAGARDEGHLQDLRRLLALATVLPTEPVHYDDAAVLFRLCRREGETVHKLTVHKLIDCLIAAVAIGVDALVLHNDKDFDVLARHTNLKIAS